MHLQVVLYKVGCLVGGAGLIHLLDVTSWTTSFNVLSLVYLVTAVWAFQLPANANRSSTQCKSQQKDDCVGGAVLSDGEAISSESEEKTVEFHSTETKSQCDSQVLRVFSILKEVIHSPGTLWLSVYVLLYKMGERGAINNMPLYLLDKGLSKQNLAFWNGTVCQGLSIIGSSYGGIILAKSNANMKRILIKHSSFRLLAVVSQWLVIFILEMEFISNENVSVLHWLGIASLCSLSYSSGVISTASFTLMMRVSRECSPGTQASHYSALASIEVAGKLLFATFAGFIIDYLGMLSTFVIFGVLCILPIVVLFVMPDYLCHLKKE